MGGHWEVATSLPVRVSSRMSLIDRVATRRCPRRFRNLYLISRHMDLNESVRLRRYVLRIVVAGPIQIRLSVVIHTGFPELPRK